MTTRKTIRHMVAIAALALGITLSSPVLGADTLIQVSDDAIEQAVAIELRTNQLLGPADIKVTSQNGFVTLHGEVTTAYDDLLVTKLAENITGVTAVQNRVAVNPNLRVEGKTARRVNYL